MKTKEDIATDLFHPITTWEQENLLLAHEKLGEARELLRGIVDCSKKVSEALADIGDARIHVRLAAVEIKKANRK